VEHAKGLVRDVLEYRLGLALEHPTVADHPQPPMSAQAETYRSACTITPWPAVARRPSI
jgi:hypothetical protein